METLQTCAEDVKQGTTIELELLPKALVEAKRVRLEGPGKIKHVRIGRIYFEKDNGLDDAGELSAEGASPHDNPLHAGPNRMVKIVVDVIADGRLTAMLDVEPVTTRAS